MNSLLQRQITKHLTDCENISLLDKFLNAISKSYYNYEDQLKMVHRATEISSTELSEANQKLMEKTLKQNEIIKTLKDVVNNLKIHSFPKENIIEDVSIEDVHKLTNLIDSQTNKIVEISKQREQILYSLERQNEELNDYAHIVSHDLKSPLRNINALTNWLKADYYNSINDEGKNILDLLLSNVDKMEALISGILEYSTVDKVETDPYAVDTLFLVNQIINTIVTPENIKLSIENKLPKIIGDKYRLQQLFQNLIQNAIKYSKPEGGTITIGVKAEGNYWQFYVKDEGIGIDKIYHEKIFEMFNKLTNNTDSTGIGLSIVKKIVTFYHGEIWVESEVNKGSTFYFKLPRI